MLLLVVLVLLCAYAISDWKTKVAYIKDLINTTLGRK